MALEDEKNQVAYDTLKALEESISDAEAERHLRYLIGHPDQWFRIQAAELLGIIKPHGAEDLLAMALNDRCEYVAEAAGRALELINTERALEIVKAAFLADVVDRPHYLANALSQMGDGGVQVLVSAISSSSPTLRYYAARGLGSSGRDEVVPFLQSLEQNDHAKTKFGGSVSAAARIALKTVARRHAREAGKS